MKKFNILLLLVSLFITRVDGQQPDLPNSLTRKESDMMPAYVDTQNQHLKLLTPIAPPTKVRTMAEWEQIQAVTISWTSQPTILREIVRNAVKECKVLIITKDSVSVASQLTNAGIPLDSVRFVNTNFNSIWVCDYGGWSVYGDEVDSLYQIDWIYNRPRPQDDATPTAVADYLHIPIYEATVEPDDFVHTGGNHFSDGLRNAFSSNLVLDENADKTEAEIDSIAKKFLGVEHYIKFPTLPFDGIHHLDMHMRIIDEETIIVGEYPDGVADGPQINANLEYLENEVQTSFGHKYRIIRIPMPPDANNRYPDHNGDYRTYTNAVFLNKTLLVPIYQEKYDTTALRIYRENLPGYNVVGINCNSIISSLGALHCITKLVGVTDPLLIAHARLRDSDRPEDAYTVSAYIRHSTGIESAEMYYRLKGDSLYVKTSMVLADTMGNIWTAIIPPQPAGSEIQYYIHARANSGREQVRPIVAPEGYFYFRVKGELINQPPLAEIDYPQDLSVFSIDLGTLPVEMQAEDADGSITQLTLYINGDSVATSETSPFVFDWNFPAEGPYELVVKAVDDKGAVTTSIPVHVTIEGTTAVDNTILNKVRLYPNPVRDYLWVDHMDLTSVSFWDAMGKRINIKVDAQDQRHGFDVSSLSPGIYFLKGMQDGKTMSMKILKR